MFRHRTVSPGAILTSRGTKSKSMIETSIVAADTALGRTTATARAMATRVSRFDFLVIIVDARLPQRVGRCPTAAQDNHRPGRDVNISSGNSSREGAGHE